eukprot:TRINITY_DN1038_c0_g1_i1.p1 TRINITY_DN1038_c0_g1~~TRINITY_DN1038_c0_g1_i1.p1  ORF type:complete len:482 (-),score=135.11 TRINITY_DN1038_c0_g1_i1:719-2164(-)
MDTIEVKRGEELGQDLLESSVKENFEREIKEDEEGFDCLVENPMENEQFHEEDTNLPAENEVCDRDRDGIGAAEPAEEPPSSALECKKEDEDMGTSSQAENAASCENISAVKVEIVKVEKENGGESEEMKDGVNGTEVDCSTEANLNQETPIEGHPVSRGGSNQSFLLDPQLGEGYESGTEEEQAAFMQELANFFRERSMEFKPPKFYGIGLNCLKLWRAVIRLGGYDKVTSCKLWRQVGESFKPPKTCTTVSWSFRGFYEKALLDYERHKIRGGELNFPVTPPAGAMSAENQVGSSQASGSGRARRDAAARAMQGWHSQRLLGSGEVGDPVIKDKNSTALAKREKQLKNLGVLKRKKSSSLDYAVKAAPTNGDTLQMDTMVVDVGPRADWVKINVRRTKDCFEVYALVPGLLREEVRVQSDPAGRLVISGDPEQPDNPWGVTSFKKVVSLPSRIDPHQTSAVVTLHGQLFVRAPFEQSEL